MGGGPDFHGYSWTDSNDPAGPNKWKISQKLVNYLKLSQMDDGYKEVSIPSHESVWQEIQKVFVNTNGYLTLGEPSSVHGHFPFPQP